MLFVKTRNSNGQDAFAYYHPDQLGTPIQATDKQGNLVWAASYNAFGQASITTPDATADKPTISSNLRLPGQYFDAETGLHYNWHRYYDPGTGRYITQDPIGVVVFGTLALDRLMSQGLVTRGEAIRFISTLPRGNLLYTYVKGNPTSLTDPFGLDTAGCDLPGGRFIRNPRVLECCAKHDKCYDDYKCTASSWWSDAQCNSKECDRCNKEVRQYFLESFTGPATDNPGQPNYYCSRQHRYIYIPGDFPTLEAAQVACKLDHK